MRLTLESAKEDAEIPNSKIEVELKPGPHDDFLLERARKLRWVGASW